MRGHDDHIDSATLVERAQVLADRLERCSRTLHRGPLRHQPAQHGRTVPRNDFVPKRRSVERHATREFVLAGRSSKVSWHADCRNPNDAAAPASGQQGIDRSWLDPATTSGYELHRRPDIDLDLNAGVVQLLATTKFRASAIDDRAQESSHFDDRDLEKP